MLDKCCIVSAGIGYWYPRGVDRLNKSLNEFGAKIPRLIYRDEYPPGCPTIETHGYAFKPHALREALTKGFRYLLWVDASIWAIKPIDVIFEKIAEDGHLFFHNGFSMGAWCRDATLPKLGIDREYSMGIPEITTSMFGLDMDRTDSQIFLERWMEFAHDGETFIVHPRDNQNGECSADVRVKGHRYDQTAGSFLVHEFGMKKTYMPNYYAYYQRRGPWTTFVNMGM